MESRAAWGAEDKEALITILLGISALGRRQVAAEASLPSPYGYYVDAVARKGFYLVQLRELARLEAKVSDWRASVTARYPDMSSPCSHCQQLAG